MSENVIKKLVNGWFSEAEESAIVALSTHGGLAQNLLRSPTMSEKREP